MCFILGHWVPMHGKFPDLMSRVCHRPESRKLLAYLTCFLAKPINPKPHSQQWFTHVTTKLHDPVICIDLWYLTRRFFRCPHTRQVATLKVVKPGEWEPMTCREEMCGWHGMTFFLCESNDIDWFYPPMKHGNRTSYMYIYITIYHISIYHI